MQRAAADLERLGAITRELPDRRARFTRATTRYTLKVRPSSSSSSRPSSSSSSSSRPSPDWWDAHCAERWALDMPGIRITSEAIEEVWLPADDAPDGVAASPCGVLPGPVPPDVRELAATVRAARPVVPPDSGAVEAVEAPARLARDPETRGAVTETVGAVSRVAEVAAMEAARAVALRARRAAWLARMALALAVLFGGLYGAGTVRDYLTGMVAFRELEPVDQAEVDQAEVDQAEVDQAEVDQAEVDQAEVDLHTFPGVTVSYKGSLESRSSGARVARALFGSARTPDPDTPPTVPRPSGRRLLGPDRDTRCDTS